MKSTRLPYTPESSDTFSQPAKNQRRISIRPHERKRLLQVGNDFYMWDDLEILALTDRADREESEPWLYCMQKTYESLVENKDYQGGLELIRPPARRTQHIQ